MKKTVVDYLNILLVIILALLAIAYGIELLKNREFEKVNYTAKIVSEDKSSSEERSNRIKIIRAELFNTSNNSDNTPTFDSPVFIYSKKSDSVYFWVKHDLFPDSLSFKYFSVEEKKFYVVNTKLSDEKIKKVVNSDKKFKVLRIVVEPKGSVTAQLEQQDNDHSLSKVTLQNFKASESTGEVSDLVYRKSLGSKYNQFPSIKTVSDYSDMIIKKFVWKLKIETEDGEKISEISPVTFDDLTIGTSSETFDQEKFRNIPQRILIKWGNKQRYGSSYNFEAKQILEAFNYLDKIKSDDPIIINFKLNKNSYPKSEVSRGKVTIPMKDLYPDNSIRYAY